MKTGYVVPVLIHGTQVGSGWLSDDGSIEMIIGHNSPLMKQLARQIQEGQVTALSIVPTTEPAQPFRTTRITGSTGVQIGDHGNQNNTYY
jgi:hypothetical protein